MVAGNMCGAGKSDNSGYWLLVHANATYTVVKGVQHILTSGNLPTSLRNLTGVPMKLSITVQGNTIETRWNGHVLAQVQDSDYTSGFASLVSGWHKTLYYNASVTSANKVGGGGPLPVWNTTIPNGSEPQAGLPALPNVEHYEIYHAIPEIGTYNHGPMVSNVSNGVLIVNWYSGATGEDAPGERVLYSVGSSDGKKWSPIAPMFDRLSPTGPDGSNGTCVSNEPFWFPDGAPDRLYAFAGVHSHCKNPSVLAGRLARQIIASGKDNVTLGPLFWTGLVPREYEKFNISTLSDMSETVQSDIQLYIRTLLNLQVPSVAAPNRLSERNYYYRKQYNDYVVLLRDDGNNTLREWASVCVDPVEQPRGTMCNWSVPQITTIPDSRTRTYIGHLQNGSLVLLGSQIPKLFDRDPLTMTLSEDGVMFDKAWSVRYGAPPKRYPGVGKGPGFQYPDAVELDNNTMWIAYSVNKEDIAITKWRM
eukprot:m.228355 g.228355  ORF g.228355 m.228355 type:complete len:477 (-) comp15976_c1_seq36:297-1727(-)